MRAYLIHTIRLTMKMMQAILTEMGLEMNVVVEKKLKGRAGVAAGTEWRGECRNDW